MRDNVSQNIQTVIAEIERELAQLDQQRADKRQELRQYRKAFKLVDRKSNGVESKPRRGAASESP